MTHWVKNSACNAGGASLIPGLEDPPGGGHDNPLQYSWPGEFHGQRSLAGYSPWARKELNTTERVRAGTHTRSSLSVITTTRMFMYKYKH